MISVAVIAKNSSSTLARCLTSVKSISDDLVVVIDPDTTDGTAQIATGLGARVFTRPFDDYSTQKNFAAGLTRHDWVLSLDADEWISRRLSGQITAAVSVPDFVAYKIPRLNIIFGRPIYHSNWSPGDDTHIWLYQKSRCLWQGKVHEEVIASGPVGKLTGLKFHHNYSSVSQFLDRMNAYTTREAGENRMYACPGWDFVRRFIWHRGFLEGWHGLFLAYLMVIYHLSIWVKSKTTASY